MNWLCYVTKGMVSIIALLLLLTAGLILPNAAHAEGGLALSGSFGHQAFEIPQGSSVTAPSVYVMVYNNGDEEINVRMAAEAPLGVNVILSDVDFVLEPGEQKKVLPEVQVTVDAVPGDYTIVIRAESYREGLSGIQLMGAASQGANLVVLGESASVRVLTASPDGEPVVAVVRLFKEIGDEEYEYASSETGVLEANVSPGTFTASAYVSGNKLAEESFQLVASESKTVTLSVATVYFEGFTVMSHWRTESGELAFMELVYTINNLYEVFPEAEVLLKVSFNGTAEDEVTLATLVPLEKGRLGLRYRYVSPGGWQPGSYGLMLELHIGDEVRAMTQEEIIDMGSRVLPDGLSGLGSSSSDDWRPNGMFLGGAGAGVLILSAVLVFSVRRRRRLE